MEIAVQSSKLRDVHMRHATWIDINTPTDITETDIIYLKLLQDFPSSLVR
jgi:hypothetical protein